MGPFNAREVSMDELRELWAELKSRNELWNGMTHHYLTERYGSRLTHVMGHGWYVITDESMIQERNTP